jgi:hypothetical protein
MELMEKNICSKDTVEHVILCFENSCDVLHTFDNANEAKAKAKDYKKVYAGPDFKIFTARQNIVEEGDY